MIYAEKTFNIAAAALKGISEKTITEHLKLYSGYVKNANLIHDKIKELEENAEQNSYIISELQRRLSFEFDGMKNHENYFEQFENGAKSPSPESALSKLIVVEWESFDKWKEKFTRLAMTRGIGWAIMYYDASNNQLELAWIDEQHLGHLSGLKVILALDMWEHSYMLDYVPSEKKKYIEAFFENINWDTVEKRLV